jgi:hypothetical protein
MTGHGATCPCAIFGHVSQSVVPGEVIPRRQPRFVMTQNRNDLLTEQNTV